MTLRTALLAARTNYGVDVLLKAPVIEFPHSLFPYSN